MPTGKLYVVATPIGNLEDITARALRLLREVDLVACEDTRRTRPLLEHFNIRTPLESYHQFSERRKLDRFLGLLGSGKSLALVSDAGTPTISDPGRMLVTRCLEEGIEVVSIPGPSALLAALTSSSFAGRPFLFWGFLPAKRTQRRETLMTLAHHEVPLVFYESPMRLVACLRDLHEVCGDRHAYVGRELTKRFEEHREGPLSALRRDITQAVRGEITLIIDACPPQEKHLPDLETAVTQAMDLMRQAGLSKKEASRRVASQTTHSARSIYQRLIRPR